MRKLSLFFVSLIILLAITPLFSFAASNPAPVVNSSIERPVPMFRTDGTYDYYKCYYIYYKQNAATEYIMCETIFHINAGEQVFFDLGTYNYSISSLSNTLVPDQVNNYNAVNGQFLSTFYPSLVGPAPNNNSAHKNYYYFSFVGGLLPNNGVNCTDSFLIADNISVLGTNDKWFSSSDFVIWYVDYSDDVIRSKIPQPLSDLHHMYLADHEHLWQVSIEYPYFYQSVGLTNGTLTAEEFYNQFCVFLNKQDYNHVNLHFVNKSEHSCSVYVSSYYVVSGEYIQTSSLIIPAIDPNVGNDVTYDFPITVDAADGAGLWYAGFLNTDGLDPFEKLKISWSDTIDYSTDFVNISLLLNDIISQLQTVNNNINTINSTLSSIYTILNNNWSWFQTTYYNSILNRWTITKQQLDNIIELLNGDGNQTTYPADEGMSSEIENYVSQENEYYSQFDSAGAELDTVIDDALNVFTQNTSGFGFIKMLLEAFVFNIPSSYIIVFISMTFGIVILILGRALNNN